MYGMCEEALKGLTMMVYVHMYQWVPNFYTVYMSCSLLCMVAIASYSR